MPEDKANIVIHLFGSDRQMLPPGFRWRAWTLDGRPKVEDPPKLYYPNLTGPSQVFTVDCFGNYADIYTVFASADGYEDMVWYPVHVNKAVRAELNMMLMPEHGEPHFANATWGKLSQARPGIAAMIRRGCANEEDAAKKYGIVQEERPAALACLLNIMTALGPMVLASGQSPIHYYWNIAWPAGDPDEGWLRRFDQVAAQDRFFCYVDSAIVKDVRDRVGHGFSQEPNPEAWGHQGATESYKQTQFDMANVQLTFHGGDVATFRDESGATVNCVKIEPDIDYFKDPVAHTLSEFIPNFITRQKSDPRVVYWMRWMMAQQGGGSFDPLYTVERQAAVGAG